MKFPTPEGLFLYRRAKGSSNSMRRAWSVIKNAASNIVNGNIMLLTAGLSFYFILSLFPLLILLAAAVGFLPIPNLFERIVDSMSSFVPADSMGLVRRIIRDVITPNRGRLLTLGILGTMWTASSGFAALITTLNIAYEVPETRPIWKTRLLAIGLMVVVGGLMILAGTSIFVGPQFGGWLADKVGLGAAFTRLWPVIRWAIAISFTVVAVELIFYLGPNVKQRHLWATLPGAVVGVGFWIGASYGLGLYFQNFANFNKTYGTLGAAIGLMVWLYYSWFMILVGAEINAEIIREVRGTRLPVKESEAEQRQEHFAWEEERAS
jgi:membrane protein